MIDARPVTGQDIGETQRAIAPLMDMLLERVGIDFPTWVTLNSLATRGPAIARDVLQRDLASALDEAPATIAGLLDRLQAGSLIREGTAGVEMTDAGRATQGRVRQGIDEVTVAVYGGIDAADLAVTRRVLVEVARRARALRGSN